MKRDEGIRRGVRMGKEKGKGERGRRLRRETEGDQMLCMALGKPFTY